MPAPHEAPRPRSPSPRDRYHGPRRFRDASEYEVRREWARYEGTPQRELLRAVREDFLRRSLRPRQFPRPPRWGLEVGPGPGRFTPLLRAAVERLLLLDVSRAMMYAALSRPEGGRSRGPRARGRATEGTLGDASRLPFRERSLDVVVELGNVVGFAGEGSLAVLQEAVATVAPGGALLLETVAVRTGRPTFVGRLRRDAWRELLRKDPTRYLEELLAQGTEREDPSGGGAPSADFHYLDAPAVARFLEREGLRVREQHAAAPLTGGDPALVEGISRSGGGALERLLAWERAAGAHPEVRALGGHLLTRATRE